MVYNSDIEIRHNAVGHHAKRDLAAFRKALDRGVKLDKTLHSMYAKELFIAGDADDLREALPFFAESVSDPSRTGDERREARCVLARAYRMTGDTAGFVKFALREAISSPCSEMCAEIGRFFYDSGSYDEALCWLNDAAFETEAVISVFSQGPETLSLLADCCEKTGDPEKAASYRRMSADWQLPETV